MKKILSRSLRLLLFLGLVFYVGIALSQSPQVAVESFKDVEYVRHGDVSVKLDLYVPEGEGPFPLVVWIHGGGWVGGDKNDCPIFNLGYCQNGYAAASVGYRLSPVAPFPAQIEDCKAAIRWLRANAKKYKIDPDRIGVIGASAGGHLVCLLGVAGKNKVFDVGENLDQSSEVQAVCNIFGPTDLPNVKAELAPDTEITKAVLGMVDGLLGGPLDDKPDLAKAASAVTYVDEHSAPFMHAHGTADLLVPFTQAEKLHDKLRQSGVSSRLFLIPRAGHGDGNFFTLPLFEEIKLFFDKHLKPLSK